MHPLFREVQALLMAGDLTGALELSERATQAHPQWLEAWEQQAELLNMLGRTEDTAVAAAAAVYLGSKQPQIIEWAGDTAPPEILRQPVRNPVNEMLEEDRAAGIPWVRKLGGTWTGIGWGLSIISFAIMITAFTVVSRFALANQNDLAKLQGNPEEVQRRLPPEFSTVLTFGFGLWIVTLLWIALDIADRSAKWYWLIGCTMISVVCIFMPYFGPAWLVIPVYILLGRPKR